MTTSDYKQLQENFTPAKLVNEVLKIHKDISEITWILSSVHPFRITTARFNLEKRLSGNQSKSKNLGWSNSSTGIPVQL